MPSSVEGEQCSEAASALQAPGQGARGNLPFPIGGIACGRHIWCRPGETPGSTVSSGCEEGVQTNSDKHHARREGGCCFFTCSHILPSSEAPAPGFDWPGGSDPDSEASVQHLRNEIYMGQALQLGALTISPTSPNPSVGAVVGRCRHGRPAPMPRPPEVRPANQERQADDEQDQDQRIHGSGSMTGSGPGDTRGCLSKLKWVRDSAHDSSGGE